MLSQGRSAAFRMDPETWQKLCAYRHLEEPLRWAGMGQNEGVWSGRERLG